VDVDHGQLVYPSLERLPGRHGSARAYDVETAPPFVCDRDGIPKASLAEIAFEPGKGYNKGSNWFGDCGHTLLSNDDRAWKRRGR